MPIASAAVFRRWSIYHDGICSRGSVFDARHFCYGFCGASEAVVVMRLLAPMAFVVLCGCASQVGEPFWVRTDGGPLNGKQFEADRVSCIDEAQKGDGPIAAPGNAVRVCLT